MNRSQTQYDQDVLKLSLNTAQQSGTSKSDVEEKRDPIHANFKMNWFHISNCIKHEMYPKIASTVISFIDKNQNHHQARQSLDLSIKSETKLIEHLKNKRKLAIEERAYLTKLIQRARSFKLITNDKTC